MLRKILATWILILCIMVPALADARFSELFYSDVHEYVLDESAADVFICPDVQDTEDFFKTGTGIALIGCSDDSWTRASVALVQEMCARYGIGVARYINLAEYAEHAQEVQTYISKYETSFANVSGTKILIEENISCDAQEMQGIVLFMNKGTIVGVHVGTAESADNAFYDISADMDVIMEQIYAYVQKLGSSPCPAYC